MGFAVIYADPISYDRYFNFKIKVVESHLKEINQKLNMKVSYKEKIDKALDIIAKFDKYKNDMLDEEEYELKYGLILQIQKQIQTNKIC